MNPEELEQLTPEQQVQWLKNSWLQFAKDYVPAHEQDEFFAGMQVWISHIPNWTDEEADAALGRHLDRWTEKNS